MKIALLLANGFEEIEALTPLDMLRRAKLDVETVGIGSAVIEGSHGVRVFADITDSEADASSYDAVILPGGMPGAKNLDESEFCDRVISEVFKKGGRIAAICAAPFILGKRGLLNGKRAVCYPGFEGELEGAVISDFGVVTDGNVTTARGMGAALDFAKELTALFAGKDTAEALSKTIMEKQ